MIDLMKNDTPYWHTCPECGEVFDLWEQEVKRGGIIYCPACFIPIGRIHVYEDNPKRYFEDRV